MRRRAAPHTAIRGRQCDADPLPWQSCFSRLDARRLYSLDRVSRRQQLLSVIDRAPAVAIVPDCLQPHLGWVYLENVLFSLAGQADATAKIRPECSANPRVAAASTNKGADRR